MTLPPPTDGAMAASAAVVVWFGVEWLSVVVSRQRCSVVMEPSVAVRVWGLEGVVELFISGGCGMEGGDAVVVVVVVGLWRWWYGWCVVVCMLMWCVSSCVVKEEEEAGD